MVVLPVPGGPQRTIEANRLASAIRRTGPSGPSKVILAYDLVQPLQAQGSGQRAVATAPGVSFPPLRRDRPTCSASTKP